MPDNSSLQYINLREGMALHFREDHPITLLAMFGLMVFASTAFECRSVVCREFLPKLDISLSIKGPLLSDEAALKQVWHGVQIALLTWLEQTPAAMFGHILLAGVELELFSAGCPDDGVVTFTRQWPVILK